MDISRWLPARATQEAGNTIKGIGASPGRVTATARVLRGPEDFGQMNHGDVTLLVVFLLSLLRLRADKTHTASSP